MPNATPNPYRGEVSARIDGQPETLRLSLGALAELESALDTPDLLALAERFETGRPAARDVLAVIRAGFRGMGRDVSPNMIEQMSFEDGIAGAYRLAGALLAAAFAAPDSSR